MDKKVLAVVAEKLDAAQLAFNEYLIALTASVRSHGIAAGRIPLDHKLTRDEQIQIYARAAEDATQRAPTPAMAATLRNRLLIAAGYDPDEPPQMGKPSIDFFT